VEAACLHRVRLCHRVVRSKWPIDTVSVPIQIAAPVLAVVAAATFTDWRTRRIPNALSLGGAALGLFLNGIDAGLTGTLVALLGFTLCLVCFLPLYMTGGMAAGDVKLMATVGAFLGPVHGFVACAFALTAGGSFGLFHMVARIRAPLESGAAARPARALDKIPYAAAIAVGTVAALLQPAWVTALLAQVTQ
jgi:prepilin peptidase CpaA